MPSLCSSIKQQYEALQTLAQEFISSCAKGKSEGNFQHLSPQELRTLQLQKHKLEQARDTLKDKLFVSSKAAEAIMNKDMGEDETKRQFFGLDAIHIAFGFDIPKQDLPPIPYSTQELKDAQKRGDYLIYRTDHIPNKTPEGTPSSPEDTKGATPLTMEKIAELVQPTLTANGQGKALYNTDWYATEPFYTEETCRSGWALVSKEPLPGSINKNYLQQTDRIVEELQTLYPATDTRPIAKTTHKAIEDFHSKRATIEQLIKGHKWKEAADILEPLLITQQTRHTASEAYYDAMLLRASTKNDSLLSNIYTWTFSRSSSGGFVSVGDADDSGARVGRWHAGNRYDDLGVLFVRSGPGVSRSS